MKMSLALRISSYLNLGMLRNVLTYLRSRISCSLFLTGTVRKNTQRTNNLSFWKVNFSYAPLKQFFNLLCDKNWETFNTNRTFFGTVLGWTINQPQSGHVCLQNMERHCWYQSSSRVLTFLAYCTIPSNLVQTRSVRLNHSLNQYKHHTVKWHVAEI